MNVRSAFTLPSLLTSALLYSAGTFSLPQQAQAQAQEPEAPWNRLAFTAVEVLTLTDQLEKLDASVCNASPLSTYSRSRTRTELLDRLSADQAARLRALLDSEQIRRLMQENSLGIERMLGEPSVAGAPQDDSRKALCTELQLTFSNNLEAATQELDDLLNRHQEL